MDKHASHLYNLWQKQRLLRRRLVLTVIIIIGLSYWLLPHLLPQKDSPTPQGLVNNLQPASGSLTKGSPTYPTITPSGMKVDWTRVSPPDHNAVYTYTDAIAGIPIMVSEQPLPADFRSDTDGQLEELAKNYGANRFITTAGSKVYIGTSTKGPQSLIFSKQSLLILIKSSSALNDNQWSAYIESLR